MKIDPSWNPKPSHGLDYLLKWTSCWSLSWVMVCFSSFPYSLWPMRYTHSFYPFWGLLPDWAIFNSKTEYTWYFGGISDLNRIIWQHRHVFSLKLVFVDLGNPRLSHWYSSFYQIKTIHPTVFPILEWVPKIPELHLVLSYHKYISIDFSYICIFIYHIYVIEFWYIFIYYISMDLYV